MNQKFLCFIAVILLHQFQGGSVGAQSTSEDEADYHLDAIVIVANRTQNLLQESTTATSVLDSAALQQLPIRNRLP